MLFVCSVADGQFRKRDPRFKDQDRYKEKSREQRASRRYPVLHNEPGPVDNYNHVTPGLKANQRLVQSGSC